MLIVLNKQCIGLSLEIQKAVAAEIEEAREVGNTPENTLETIMKLGLGAVATIQEANATGEAPTANFLYGQLLKVGAQKHAY